MQTKKCTLACCALGRFCTADNQCIFSHSLQISQGSQQKNNNTGAVNIHIYVSISTLPVKQVQSVNRNICKAYKSFEMFVKISKEFLKVEYLCVML